MAVATEARLATPTGSTRKFILLRSSLYSFQLTSSKRRPERRPVLDAAIHRPQPSGSCYSVLSEGYRHGERLPNYYYHHQYPD